MSDGWHPTATEINEMTTEIEMTQEQKALNELGTAAEKLQALGYHITYTVFKS